MKLSRNDPCPCGSGKKYKQCCLQLAVVQTSTSPFTKPHDGAISKSLHWLKTHQRKGWQLAYDNLMQELLIEEDLETLRQLDAETTEGIDINLTEWLLAEGSIRIQGAKRQIADYLIGPFGPSFTPGQRDWIQQLAQRPLRLYRITHVIPGQQMTLCDVLNEAAEPVVVMERAGSQSASPGMMMGARVMRVQEHCELSGAVYPFSIMAGQDTANRLQEVEDAFGHLPDLAQELAWTLMSSWLQQYVAPMRMPDMIDSYSGDTMVSITDYYKVNDWQAFTKVLQNCPEMEGNQVEGWSRLLDCDDGLTRPILSINLGKKPNHVQVFYRTQNYADQGRAWLEDLAGSSLSILTRRVADPQSMWKQSTRSKSKTAKTSAIRDIDPNEFSKLIEGVIRKTYANWCDEPIPALSNKTPREAIQTSAGLERVKGLLRSYQASENEQANQQGRSEVSYEFLWIELGIRR
jgi:hypothetical protein